MAKYTFRPEVEKDIQAELKEKQIRLEEIVIPDKLATSVDKKTGVRSVFFPFMLPDGVNAAVIVTRLESDAWNPAKDIEKIVIHMIK